MKFTRTLLAISILSAAQLTTAQAKKPDAFVQQLLEKQYPHNEKALKAFNKNTEGEKAKRCYFKEDKELSNEGDGMYGYCMDFIGEKIVDTTQDKRRYVFFSGDSLMTCRGCSGLDSLFIFTSTDGKDWSLLSHKETDGGGSWGKGSGAVKWQETGPGVWGVITEGSFSQGGATQGITQILHDDGKEIRETVIPTLAETTGMADCDDKEYLKMAEKSQAECYANETALEATVKVRKDLPAVGNTYPLQVTINGYDGLKSVGKGKKAKTQPIKAYKNQKFLFPYNPDKHEYMMPADYPKSLRFLDDMENTGNQ